MVHPPAELETDLDALRILLGSVRTLVFDFETSDVRPRIATIAGLGVYLPEAQRRFYINVGHLIPTPDIPKYAESDLAAAMRVFFAEGDRHAIAHNAPYDLRMLFKLGVDVRCRVSDSMVHVHRADENLRSWGREATVRAFVNPLTYGLKELTAALFNVRPPTLHGTIGGVNPIFAPPLDVARYCALDCTNTWNLYLWARERMDRTLLNLTAEIDDPNNVVLAKMLWEGVGVDVEEARRQLAAYERAIQACRETIWRTLGLTWPLETPDQVRRVLRQLNLGDELPYEPFFEPIDGVKEPSIASEILEDVFAECGTPEKRLVIACILSMQAMKQRVSSFLIPLPEKVRYTDGRLYPDRFSSTLATTRFSSSPNVQNLPKRADVEEAWQSVLPPECHEAFKTRNILIARPGCVLMSVDLKAAEPRYLAILFQRSLEVQDSEYWRRRRALQMEREIRYPVLHERMQDTQDKRESPERHVIMWPDYQEDPLWKVFRYGVPFDDPYNALLAAIDREGYECAVQDGTEAKWLKGNRWRGKLAFLALAYGSQADTLAPRLKWTVDRTRQAIENLEREYAVLKPLRELTFLEMIHLGEVRTLWGRPRRINGYYQLAQPKPCKVQFYRLKPTPRTYEADIIPLGVFRQGVQAFVQQCRRQRPDDTWEVVLEGNPDGTVRHVDRLDSFVRAEHFNRIPFRNIGFSQINWVEDEYQLKRFLPKQSRGQRQAFNALCQATGADHLRWLMNAVDREVCRLPEFGECKLVLTVHDALVYEVPKQRQDAFLQAVLPVVRRRPDWATIDIEVEVEVGDRFGEMTTLKGV